MNILLIYPGIVDGFHSYARGCDWINHGVGIISSVLKQHGHMVHYLDCRRLRGWGELAERIHACDFEIALISVATVDFDSAKKIARIVKEKNHALKVMVGGPHPTLMTAETAVVKDFDFIFSHEAEITLPNILHDITQASRIIRGVTPPDLDALPFVDRDLTPGGESPWFYGLPRPYYSITASRGCPFQCTFCQPAERRMFGDKIRKRSVDNILTEMEYLQRVCGMRSFMIHDDCFTQFNAWIEEFCEKKERQRLNQSFACQSPVSFICARPDLLKKLRKVGLQWVSIGFESGSDRVLDFIKKKTTVGQNIEAARICRELGIKIFANYMFGLPTETKTEMKETVRMIRSIRPEIYSPAIFTPAPGSELFDYCREKGLTLVRSSEGYRRNVFSGAKIKGVDYDFVNRMVLASKHGTIIGLIHLGILLLKRVLKVGPRRLRRADDCNVNG